MIGCRGPHNVLVVDRTCVPVFDVCNSVLDADAPEDLMSQYQINETEIFECIEIFSDIAGVSDADFLELSVVEGEELDIRDLNIETIAVSDWVFLTLVNIGYNNNANTNRFGTLYAYGLQSVLIDCLMDMAEDVDFRISEVHRIVFDAFEYIIGDITKDMAESIIEGLKNGQDDQV